MIFLRSTLREFTAAGIAVFLVLLVDHLHHAADPLPRLRRAAAASRPTRCSSCSVSPRWATFRCCCPHTLFLSVLLTMTRAYRDSEMVVWQSSGLGLAGLVQAGAAVRDADRAAGRRC